MIPVGYVAKRSCGKPAVFKMPSVADIYSVSSCVNDNFAADYVRLWKHNGNWLFDSPEIIQKVAKENGIDLEGTLLFYYEVHEMEFDGERWRAFGPAPSISINIEHPLQKRLEGFDVVTFYAGSSPECSPLSCNGLADEIPTNSHCLLESFEVAESCLNSGKFAKGEPGPY